MKKNEFDEINLQGFVSVMLAALLLGFTAHEIVHVVLISNPSKITIHFGSEEFALTTCCLEKGEMAYEEIAYGIQFLTTIAWIIGNRHVFLKPG